MLAGESGPRARPCDVGWIRKAIADCRAMGVPVFVKQLGGNIRGLERDGLSHDKIADALGSTYRLADAKGGDMEERPADLRVREFPKVGMGA